MTPALASRAELIIGVYAWLGLHRDHIDPDAVCALQDILGPLEDAL